MTQPKVATSTDTGPSLRHDLLASIVVFLVALPLCMGIAIASGVPVAAGLINGIVGGLVVGVLAGSPLQVSGPAAGLTVIVFEAVQEFGLSALGIVVLIAGVLQLLAGVFKLGQWFRAVSPAVVHGMLSGIGVLIFASQIQVMIDSKPKENGIRNLLAIPTAIQQGLPLPSWGSATERNMRAELLRNVVDLQKQQASLAAALGEMASDEQSGAQDVKLQDTLRGQWVATQADISSKLDRERDTIQGAEYFQREDDKPRVVRDAVALAVATTKNAQEQLQAASVPDAQTAVAAAAVAQNVLVDALKNREWAAKIGLLTILIIVLWMLLAPKKLKIIPAPLLAVVIATALATTLHLPVLYVDVPARLTDGITFPSFEVLGKHSLLALFQTGLLIAIIASAETLLCATAVDQMHQGPRTKYDKELAAQGVGNIICGILGAIPMTGVIVRSAANVQAGGRSRWSSIMHGMWLLLFVVLFGPLLRMIPTSCLAGILVYTGYRLIAPKTFFELWKHGKMEAFIFLTTVVVIVGEDLLTGVVTGVVLSALKLLWTFSHLEVKIGKEADNRTILELKGAATFIRLPVLAKVLEAVPASTELHVDLKGLDYIDQACLELLMNWEKQHASTGGRLFIDWGHLHSLYGQRPSKATRKVAEVEQNAN